MFFSPFFDTVDTTFQNRFLSYPPLFPLLLGFLLKINPTAPTAILLIAFLNIITLCLCGWIFYKFSITKTQPLTWPSALLIIVSLAGVSTHFMAASEGRPEVLASMWVALGLVVVISIKPKNQWLFFGVLLGLLITTHPIAAAISAMVLFLYYSFQNHYTFVIIEILKLGLVAVATTFLIMLFSPYSIADTLSGIIRHATILNAGEEDNASFLYYFFATHYATFYGLALLLALVGAGYLLWLNRRKVAAKWFFYPVCLGLIVFLYLTTLSHPNRNYNIFLFFPIFFGVNILFFNNFDTLYPNIKTLKFKAYRLKYVFLFVAFLTSAGLCYDLILFPGFMANGVHLDTARNSFEAVKKSCGPTLGISDQYWYLSEDYKHTFVYNYEGQWLDADGKVLDNINTKSSLIVKQGEFYDESTQAALTQFTLADNYIKGPVPRFFGVKLSESLPGYSYAVYVPKQLNILNCATSS